MPDEKKQDDQPEYRFEPFPIKRSTVVTAMILLIICIAAGFAYRIVNYGFQ